MINRTTRLRWRRRVRRRQRQIEGIGSVTEENLDKHFFRRLGRLYEVRRFLLTWIMLVIVLISALVVQTRALGDYFLKVVPVSGGIYSEGIIGSYTNANPIFASSDVDATVSKLIFSGLLTYDNANNLIGDLAQSWSVDEDGKVYTFKLRDDVKWHDGAKLTSKDVVFTYQSIQNPDTRSPYFSSWQGIVIEAPDEHTAVFKLPNVLASFPYSLTTGIIPEHILSATDPAELRGSLFNTVEPVGTGPFRWNDVEVRGETTEDREQRVALSANEHYYRGRPNFSEFIVRSFLEEAMLMKSFDAGELNAVAGIQSMPLHSNTSEELSIPLAGAVMVFFRTSHEVLQDVKVRRALTLATDQKEIRKLLGFTSIPVESPLLPEHIGYNPNVLQYSFSLEQAVTLLSEAGWVVDPNTGIRTKDGKTLSITLNTLNSAEYATVANQLQKQWQAVGVNLLVNSLPQRELQTAIDERSYDALMYGIVMGSDPDQFAYWHSSQADVRSQQRLNFSEYKSGTVDTALEAGRTRIDPALRAAKYLPFLHAWREDAPAIALYKPRFLYTIYSKLYNFDPVAMNSPVDRFSNVHEWMIRTDRAAQ